MAMNRMLISARNARETRVALMHGEQLYDLDTESVGSLQRKANIYKGVVARIEPSLEAAFVDYGADRHGFLPLKEIARSCFKTGVKLDSMSNLSIRDVIYEGQALLVQVEKEERGNKGAALTTFISLAGSYLVLMPNNPRVGGISRQIEGKERDDLKEKLKRLVIPEGMGVIIRTAGLGKSDEDLVWDLEMLLKRWHAIDQAAAVGKAPLLIHREDDAVIRAIRDYLRYDVDEIIVDTEVLYERAKRYIEVVRPNLLPKLRLYRDSISLFSRYRLEQQIESVYHRVVKLPSGGSISIDPTEALISIDVNSARATGGSDIEETALNTNLEAAEEIARQLRIRDIGGLVVIDFIDMAQLKNQRAVSQRLREALSYDRARVKVGFITRFGLLEMSRQRIRSDLDSVSQASCPRCEGRGTIRTIESLSASVVRVVEEVASAQDISRDKDMEIQVVAPVDLASYLLNEYRDILAEMSQRLAVRIVVLPSRWMETPHYEIKQVHKKGEASYAMLAETVDASCKLEVIGDAGVGGNTAVRHGMVHSEQPLVSNELDDVKARRCSCGFWSGARQLFKNVVDKLRSGMSDPSRKLDDGQGVNSKGRKHVKGVNGGGNSKNSGNGVAKNTNTQRVERAELSELEDGRRSRNAASSKRRSNGGEITGRGSGAAVRNGATPSAQVEVGKGMDAVSGKARAISLKSGKLEQRLDNKLEENKGLSSAVTSQTGDDNGTQRTATNAVLRERRERKGTSASDGTGANGSLSMTTNMNEQEAIRAVSDGSKLETAAVDVKNSAGSGKCSRRVRVSDARKSDDNNRSSGRNAERLAGLGGDSDDVTSGNMAAVKRRTANAGLDDVDDKSRSGILSSVDGPRMVAEQGLIRNEGSRELDPNDNVEPMSDKVAGPDYAVGDLNGNMHATGHVTGGRRGTGAYSRMELFRTGLLGPVTSKLEIPVDSGEKKADKPVASINKRKPLIGPVSLDPVVQKAEDAQGTVIDQQDEK